MAFYNVTWKASALKELRKLPKEAIARIVPAAEALGSEPRPEGARKLVGSENIYRIRIGDYRVVYLISDRQLIIEIIRVRDRKEAYR
jgi:Cytotoxic translational repressor of toxin-antitoxin stability system